MPNCNAHCRSCDRCFTGTSAFDKHRAGKHGEDRRCEDPGEVEMVPHDGTCDVSQEEPFSATVWASK